MSLDSSPAVKLRDELARARREGKDFDDVFPFAILRATQFLPTGKPVNERESWRDVFNTTRNVWRAAYYREHVPDVLGLIALLHGFD